MYIVEDFVAHRLFVRPRNEVREFCLDIDAESCAVQVAGEIEKMNLEFAVAVSIKADDAFKALLAPRRVSGVHARSEIRTFE